VNAHTVALVFVREIYQRRQRMFLKLIKKLFKVFLWMVAFSLIYTYLGKILAVVFIMIVVAIKIKNKKN